jgi:hypothetical protein
MTETATASAPAVKFDDEMQELTFNMLAGFIKERNALVGRVNAASGDRESLTESIRESDDDPEIVAKREAWAQAYEDLMALVTPKVEEVLANSQGSTTEYEEKIKEIDAKLKPGVTYFKKLYQDSNPGVVEALPSQDRLKGASVGRTGAGGRRVRGFNVVITADGETEEFENFASAAKFLDVETAELQKRFFEKAGTDVLKDVPDEVNLTVNYEEVDEDENVTVKEAFVRAYRTAPAGNSESADSNDSSDEDESDEQ